MWRGLPDDVWGHVGGRFVDWGEVPAEAGRLQCVYAGRALDYVGSLVWAATADCYRVRNLETGVEYVVITGRQVLGCTCGLSLLMGFTGPCRHVLAAVRSKALSVECYRRALWC